MNFEQIIDSVDDHVETIIDENFVLVTKEKRKQIRLDTRALPSQIWFSDDALLVKTEAVRMLDYYGGFEYVDGEHRSTLGKYTMFSNECSRVAEVLDALNETVEEKADQG